jgi:hypothetical protein
MSNQLIHVKSCSIKSNHVIRVTIHDVIHVIRVHWSYNVSYEAFSIISGGWVGVGGPKVLSRPSAVGKNIYLFHFFILSLGCQTGRVRGSPSRAVGRGHGLEAATAPAAQEDVEERPFSIGCVVSVVVACPARPAHSSRVSVVAGP